MKKKLLIGTFALASVFAMSSFGGDEETDRRPMFGSEITGWGPCHPTGEIMADGTPVLMQEVQVTTYVFWIGFHSIREQSCN